MNNLISTCYVIEHSYGVEPVIYLHSPKLAPDNNSDWVHTFDNPFSAQAFIRLRRGLNSKVVIAKTDPKDLKAVSG